MTEIVQCRILLLWYLCVFQFQLSKNKNLNLRRPIPQAPSLSLSAVPAFDLLPSSISPFSPSVPTRLGHCSCFALVDYLAEAIDIDVVESLDVSVDVVVAVAGQCWKGLGQWACHQ